MGYNGVYGVTNELITGDHFVGVETTRYGVTGSNNMFEQSSGNLYSFNQPKIGVSGVFGVKTLNNVHGWG